MCNDTFNPRLAPLNADHLASVQSQFPDQAAFAQSAYDALVADLTPQANLLVAFVTLKHMCDQGMAGIFKAFGQVLYVPLSIVSQTGPHEWTRFRPTAVEELHSSFLSFMMATSNLLAIERLFAQHGLKLTRRHCCGMVVGKIADVERFEASEEAAVRNEMRSYAESMGMPVKTVTFEDIPLVNSDLGQTEALFYRMYEETFAAMKLQSRTAHIRSDMHRMWEQIVLGESGGTRAAA